MRLRSAGNADVGRLMRRASAAGARWAFSNLRTRGVATISLSALPFFAALTAPAAKLVALAAGLTVLFHIRRAIQETTLTSTWWWSLAALVSWSAASLLQVGSPLRFAAIAMSFCPAVALIGAKRPQHLAWNFVVVSLWAIVILPAAENLFLHPGRPVEMGDARGWFLWILILLAPINFVPTRHWPAAILLACGQIAALGPHLPLLRNDWVADWVTRLGLPGWFAASDLAGMLLAVAAMIAAWARRLTSSSARSCQAYDRLWLGFRDTFGLFWSLRVQERVNAAARQYGWPLELAWSGFRSTADGAPLAAVDPAIEPVLRTTLRGLLRRFVSNRWIAERTGQGVD